jgi:ankyrin repeat protein
MSREKTMATLAIGSTIEVVDRVVGMTHQGREIAHLKLADGRGWVQEKNKKTGAAFFVVASSSSRGSGTVAPPHGAQHGHDPFEAWTHIGSGSDFEHVCRYVHYPEDEGGDAAPQRASAFDAYFGGPMLPRLGSETASGMDVMGKMLGGSADSSVVERNRTALHTWFTGTVFSKQLRFSRSARRIVYVCSSAAAMPLARRIMEAAQQNPDRMLRETCLLVIDAPAPQLAIADDGVRAATQRQLTASFCTLAKLLVPLAPEAATNEMILEEPRWAKRMPQRLDSLGLTPRSSSVAFVNTSGGVSSLKSAAQLAAKPVADQYILAGERIDVDHAAMVEVRVGGKKQEVTFLHLRDGRGWVLAHFGNDRVFFTLAPKSSCFAASRYAPLVPAAEPIKAPVPEPLPVTPPPPADNWQPMPPPEEPAVEIPEPPVSPPPAPWDDIETLPPPPMEAWTALPPSRVPPAMSALASPLAVMSALPVPPNAMAALRRANVRGETIALPTFELKEWLDAWIEHQNKLQARSQFTADAGPNMRHKLNVVDAAIRARSGMARTEETGTQLGYLNADPEFLSYLLAIPMDTLVAERKSLAALIAALSAASMSEAAESGPLLWLAAGVSGDFDGEPSMVSATRIANGCDVNFRNVDTDTTILHRAILSGNVMISLGLIVAGCDPNLPSGDVSPLHVACELGRGNIVAALVLAGADVAAVTHGDHSTALHIACERSELSIVKFLLESGVDRMAARYPSGECALHIAARMDNAVLALILLSTPVVTATLMWHDQLRMLSAPMQNKQTVLKMPASKDFRGAIEQCLAGYSDNGELSMPASDYLPLRSLSTSQVSSMLHFLGWPALGAAFFKNAIDGAVLATLTVDAAVRAIMALPGTDRRPGNLLQVRASAEQLVHAVRAFDRVGTPLVAVSTPVAIDESLLLSDATPLAGGEVALSGGDASCRPLDILSAGVVALHACVGRIGLRSLITALFESAGTVTGVLTKDEYVFTLLETVKGEEDVWSRDVERAIAASFDVVFDAVFPHHVNDPWASSATSATKSAIYEYEYGSKDRAGAAPGTAVRFASLAGVTIALAVGASSADSASAAGSLLFEIFSGNTTVLTTRSVTALLRTVLRGFALRGLLVDINTAPAALRARAEHLAAECCNASTANDVFARWVEQGGRKNRAESIVPFRDWERFWTTHVEIGVYCARAKEASVVQTVTVALLQLQGR